MPHALADFIESHTAAAPMLHLVHCTTSLSALKMLEADSIELSLCPVYKTPLLYMFYGRPAFKPSQNLPASGLLELAPVCFILDPSLADAAARILPFDSGGFKRYSNIIGPGLQMNDYELSTRSSSPPHTVGAFFTTNRNYFDQKPTLGEKAIGFADAAARGYARLIADQSIRADDDRCGTIEVQFSAPIKLSSSLRGIVAPSAVLDDPAVATLIATAGAAVVPLPYKTYGRTDVGGLMYALYERVDTFLTDQGSLP